MVKITSIKAILSPATKLDLEIEQPDVKLFWIEKVRMNNNGAQMMTKALPKENIEFC